MSGWTKPADLFDIHLLESEARRRCAANDVKVMFKEGLPSAMYDFKLHTVVLPALSANKPYDETEYRRFLIHEVGHSNRRDVVTRAQGLDMQHPFGQLLNIVEDEVMERGISEQWYGDGVSLGLGHRRGLETDIQYVVEATANGAKIDEATAKTNAAYMMTQRARTWDKISKAERDLLDDVIPDEIRSIVNELDKEGWTERLRKTNTCDEVYKYTSDLHKRLFPDPEDKDPESECRKSGAAKGAGKDAAGGKKPADGKAGKGTPSETYKDTLVEWRNLKKHDDTLEGGLGGKIDWAGYHYTHIGGQPNLLPTEVRAPLASPRMASYGDKAKVPDLPIAQQLRIMLLSEGKAKVLTEQTSGKLDKRKLARLGMPVVPGTDSWRKVFRKRIPSKKLNTAISILVDGSGSMGGPTGSGLSKMQVAAGAAAATCKALTGPLRIPTEVLGFSTGGGKNIMVPIKEFHEVVRPEEVAQRAMGLPMSGNSDGESMLWAAERLLKRKEKRKVLLVLSDGCPADGTGRHNPGDMLTYAIGACRKKGIEVYGIGIQDKSVKTFYGQDCKVINDGAELASALVSTLSSKLHRK